MCPTNFSHSKSHFSNPKFTIPLNSLYIHPLIFKSSNLHTFIFISSYNLHPNHHTPPHPDPYIPSGHYSGVFIRRRFRPLQTFRRTFRQPSNFSGDLKNFPATFFRRQIFLRTLQKVMASSSSSSSHNRHITYEPDFLEPTFRGHNYTEVGLRILNTPGLRPLFHPPKVAYPRVVRAFYDSFESGVDEDGIAVFSCTIDGREFHFTYEDIAVALGLPNYRTKSYDTSSLIMCNSLNVRPKAGEEGNSIRTSYLHEDFWLVDQFLYYVMCPMIHSAERPRYVWKYWYGMYKRKGLDVPMMMMEMVGQVLLGGRTKKAPHPFIYPRFLTAILSHVGYQFRDDEERMTKFWDFTYETVDRSFKALARAADIAAPAPARAGRSAQPPAQRRRGRSPSGDQADAQAEEAPVYEAGSRSQPHYISQADYEEWRTAHRGYETRLTGMETRLTGMETQLTGMETVQDDMRWDMDDMSRRVDMMYHVQRLSMQDSAGPERTDDIYAQAAAFAETSYEDRRQRRAQRPGRRSGGDQ